MQQKDILKLISLYKKHQCLWNVNSKLYRRAVVKQAAYEKIAAEMGYATSFIRNKIKNLRTCYTANKKKLETLKISGSGIEDVKECTLFYFDEMTFLDPFIIYRKGNLRSKAMAYNNWTSEDTLLESQKSNSWNLHDEKETHFENVSVEINNSPSPDTQNHSPSPETQHNSPSPNCLPMNSSTTGFDDALAKFISVINSESEKDEFDLFGESIATQLRKIPEIHSIQFIASVQQQMTDLRIRLINSQMAHKPISKSIY